MYNKQCEVCKGRFKAKRSDAKTCSTECRVAKSAMKLFRNKPVIKKQVQRAA